MQEEVEGGQRREVEAGRPPKVKVLQARLERWEGQVPQVVEAGAQGEAVPLRQPACQINCD